MLPRSLHRAVLVTTLALAATRTSDAQPPTAPPPSAGETVVLAAPVALRALADPFAAEIARLPAGASVLLLERHGDWLRLRAGELTGWIALADLTGQAPPPKTGPATGPGREPPDGRLLGERPEVTAALETARQALGPTARHGRLGPFALLTDVEDAALLAFLGRVAAQVPDAFTHRYGLPVPGAVAGASSLSQEPIVHPVLGTVVLFTRQEDYRAFTRGLAALSGGAVDPDELVGLDLAGQTAPEVASLAVQGSTPRQVARTLVHEAVHLMVRLTLGEDAPVWLDEGLAGDLELGRIEPEGRLEPGTLRPPPRRAGSRPHHEGPLAALAGLLADARQGRLERIEDLLALDRAGFQRSARRPQLYALTALWVRYLIDGEDGTLAPGFRAWLAAAAADPARLSRPSDVPLEPTARPGGAPADLDRAFRVWLGDLARRLRAG